MESIYFPIKPIDDPLDFEYEKQQTEMQRALTGPPRGPVIAFASWPLVELQHQTDFFAIFQYYLFWILWVAWNSELGYMHSCILMKVHRVYPFYLGNPSEIV